MSNGVKKINLALQGGGSHGAFAWGALTRILEEEALEIVGVSGTSAGSMNAVMMVYGHAIGGYEGAIEMLRTFWTRISEMGKQYPFHPTLLDKIQYNRGLDYNPFFAVIGMLSSAMSPYQFNPMNMNPLRDLVDELVDFEVLRKKSKIQLFLCATNVLTSSSKVFRGEEISLQAVMASACLPNLFQAVEVDGEFYWDGGYTANPPFIFFPYTTDCGDVLFILVNPFSSHKLPVTPQEIMDRLNIVSFNSSLIKDLKFIGLLKEMGVITGKDIPEALVPMSRLLLHAIHSQDKVVRYVFSSKYNTEMEFLEELHKLGYMKADQWIKKNFDKINVQSTFKFEELGLSIFEDWHEELKELGIERRYRVGAEWIPESESDKEKK